MFCHFSRLPPILGAVAQSSSFTLLFARWLLQILSSHENLRRGSFPSMHHIIGAKYLSTKSAEKLAPLATTVSCAPLYKGCDTTMTGFDQKDRFSWDWKRNHSLSETCTRINKSGILLARNKQCKANKICFEYFVFGEIIPQIKTQYKINKIYLPSTSLGLILSI